MESVGVDNDTRGWIMCIVSGIACVMGASIICVDLLIRWIPSQKDFRIQDSNAFLACSLSLSFGVMIFSALYSMLPESKEYFLKDKWDDQAAGFMMMGCFVGGFFGIQVLSRLLHQLMPSHVVDCDHTHDDISDENHSDGNSRQTSRSSRFRQKSRYFSTSEVPHMVEVNEGNEVSGRTTESTPLLAESVQVIPTRPELPHRDLAIRSDVPVHPHNRGRSRGTTQDRRPSILQVQRRVMSFVRDTKTNCDEYGPCFGYTDPCGQECFKHLGSRSALTLSRAPTFVRTTTGVFPNPDSPFVAVPEDEEETSPTSPPRSPTTYRRNRAQTRGAPQDASKPHPDAHSPTDHAHDHDDDDDDDDDNHEYDDEESGCEQMDEDLEAQHHHHVPTNAFLSIGLQTVVAIALHKFPEGFITYATNHANPSLGFNVFMALAVHNIAEGFALALPLYMALGSRWKAMLWSSLLGGASQPLGAALAVLWFHVANRSHLALDNTAYACLFSVTAGIMTSVALQLFVESLSLNHNRNLSIFFAFLGMTLLGVSNAMVTD